mgnify:CR=1 FL=1
MAVVQQAGFEIKGEFFPWHLTDKIKDLQLIDHFAQMPPADFFSSVEDDFDRSRTPILTAMMATSIRHGRQAWSMARVIRMVEDLAMSEVTFVEGEEEEDDEEKVGASVEEKSGPLEEVVADPGTTSAEEEDTPDSSQKSKGRQATVSKTS